METILIIDDEPVGRSLLREMLDDGSYRFECAASSREARQIVAERGAAIKTILLDWNLPDTNGLELLEWLQDQPSLAAVEVVIQSAVFDPEYIERAIACGAYFCLVKPFEKSQLRAIVRAAIDTCELRRELTRKIEETEDTFDLLGPASTSSPSW